MKAFDSIQFREDIETGKLGIFTTTSDMIMFTDYILIHQPRTKVAAYIAQGHGFSYRHDDKYTPASYWPTKTVTVDYHGDTAPKWVKDICNRMIRIYEEIKQEQGNNG